MTNIRNVVLVAAMLLIYAAVSLLTACPWDAVLQDRTFPVIAGFSVLTLVSQLPKAVVFLILGIVGRRIFRPHSLRWTLIMAVCSSLLQLVFTQYHPVGHADLVIFTNYLVLVAVPPVFSFIGYQVAAILWRHGPTMRSSELPSAGAAGSRSP